MSLEKNKIISNFQERLSSIKDVLRSINDYRASNAYVDRLSSAKYINHWNPTSDFWINVDSVRAHDIAYIKSGKVSKRFINVLGGGGYFFKSLTLEYILSSEFLFEWDFLGRIKSIDVGVAANFGRHPLQIAGDISTSLEAGQFDNIINSFKTENDLKMFLAVFWQQISFDWRPISNQRQYYCRDGYQQVDLLDTVIVGNRVNPLVFSALLQTSLSNKSRVFYTNNTSRLSAVFGADYGINILPIGPVAIDYVSTLSQSVSFPMINFPLDLDVKNLSKTRLIIDDPCCELSLNNVRKLVNNGNVIYILMSNPLVYQILVSGEFHSCEMFLSDKVAADNALNYNYLIVGNGY